MAEENTAGQDDTDTSTTQAEDSGTLLTGESSTEENATANESGTEEGTDAEGGDAEGEGGEGSGVPEGDYELSLPKGVDVDTGLLEAMTPTLKELGLNNEQASKLAGIYAEQLQKDGEARSAALQAQTESWGQELVKDPEMGGDKFDTTVARAAKAVKQFGTPALMQMLDETGLGNHPELVRAFSKIGEKLKEDTAEGGDGPAGGVILDDAEAIYGKSGTK